MRVGRFEIEKSVGWTQCDCPDSLCPHQDRRDGPTGMRPYDCWVVVDIERDEHAYLVHPGAFEHEYERRRDAVAAARAFEARLINIL